MSVPKPPKVVISTVIYAQDKFWVPPMGSKSLKLTFFEQGSYVGHAQLEIPMFYCIRGSFIS